MATTRIMPLHVGKGRTESRAISDIIDYVANPRYERCCGVMTSAPAETYCVPSVRGRGKCDES